MDVSLRSGTKNIRALLVGACIAAITVPSVSRGAMAGALQYEALPLIRSAQNHLLVRAEVNGKPALFAVDTGAPVSAIALNRRAHFGMSPVSSKSAIPARLSINGAFNSVAIARNLRDK